MPPIEPDYLSLPELVDRWSKPIDHILRFGSEGKLTISAMADAWLVQIEENSETPGTDNKKEIEVDRDWITLVPEDIRACLNKDHVEVRRIKLDEGKYGVLKEPVNIRAGALYVSIQERNQFEEEYGPGQNAKSNLADRYQAPYLDANHEYFSEELETAVLVWLAICQNGDFKPNRSPKSQIKDWLRKNNKDFSSEAISRIATLVNPRKRGGSPKSE